MQIVDHRDVGLYKYASEDVKSCLSSTGSEPGKTKVLVLAMSASEYYGPNRNGDAFSERPVKVKGSWAVAPGEELPAHHKTFETSAHVYRHHINKDPKKSFGAVGRSFYNWKMHRVELLLTLDNIKGNDIVGKIDGGEFPGVSMGCRIRYDVCDICGNRAPTRAQYCDHVSGLNPTYGMNRLLPSGERCFVWNPSPHLFDISFVFKPADKIGYMMQKVAYSDSYAIRSSADLACAVEAAQEKTSVLRKLSTIDKVLQGEVVNPADTPYAVKELDAMKSWVRSCAPTIAHNTPDFDEDTLKELSRSPIHITMTTMSACGIVPSARELFSILCHQRGLAAPPEVRDLLGALQGPVCSLLSDFPGATDYVDDIEESIKNPNNISEKVAQILYPWMEKRSMWTDYLARRYVPEEAGAAISAVSGWDPSGAYYSPTRQAMHYQDPTTRRVYQTTRHSAERADWENKKKLMIEAGGLATGLGVGTKAILAKGKWSPHIALPSFMLSGVFGKKIMDQQRVPKVRTLEGYDVPANTEFIEKRGGSAAYLAPAVGGALAAVLLAQDYRRGGPVTSYNEHTHNVGRAVHGAPEYAAVGLTAAGSGLSSLLSQARHGVSKLGSYAPDLPEDPADTDFSSSSDIFEKIGALIFAYALR